MASFFFYYVHLPRLWPLLVSHSSFPPPALQYVPPDLCICNFVLEQSLSVRALQEMLANTGQSSEGVSARFLPPVPLTHTWIALG